MSATHFAMFVRRVHTKFIKSPIHVHSLEGRYAMALFSAASKTKQLDNVEKELVKLQETLKTDKKLRDFLENPTYKRKHKSEAMKAIGKKLAMTPSSSNLLVLLAENGRLKKLNNVINAYKSIMVAQRGEVTCNVITAKKLDQTQCKQLEETLKKFVKEPQIVKLNLKVDASIIGGMIVTIGDKYVDMSVATKIKKYTELISKAI